MTAMKNSTACLTLLSQLLLGSERRDNLDYGAGEDSAPDWAPEIAQTVALYARQDFGELWSLATSHHVILRAFPSSARSDAGAGKTRVAVV